MAANDRKATGKTAPTYLELREEILRRDQAFWRELHDLVPVWDDMITAFNRDAGVAGAR